MCTRCALALDGIEDGEVCISLGIWHGYACVECTGPQMRVGSREVALHVWDASSLVSTQ